MTDQSARADEGTAITPAPESKADLVEMELPTGKVTIRLRPDLAPKAVERGTIGMARTANPNSANSQFFIMFAPGPFLDGQYTIVGQVISGMDAVDKIKRGSGQSGMVQDPTRIISMRMESGAH